MNTRHKFLLKDYINELKPYREKSGLYVIVDNRKAVKPKVYTGSADDLYNRLSGHGRMIKRGKHEYDEFNDAFALNSNQVYVYFCVKEFDNPVHRAELEQETLDALIDLGVFDVLNRDKKIKVVSPISEKARKNLSTAQQSYKNGNSKYSRAQLIEVFDLLSDRVNVSNVAKITRVDKCTVSKMKNGTRHKALYDELLANGEVADLYLE